MVVKFTVNIEEVEQNDLDHPFTDLCNTCHHYPFCHICMQLTDSDHLRNVKTCCYYFTYPVNHPPIR